MWAGTLDGRATTIHTIGRTSSIRMLLWGSVDTRNPWCTKLCVFRAGRSETVARRNPRPWSIACLVLLDPAAKRPFHKTVCPNTLHSSVRHYCATSDSSLLAFRNGLNQHLSDLSAADCIRFGRRKTEQRPNIDDPNAQCEQPNRGNCPMGE